MQIGLHVNINYQVAKGDLEITEFIMTDSEGTPNNLYDDDETNILIEA